jgi:hypothetical protein
LWQMCSPLYVTSTMLGLLSSLCTCFLAGHKYNFWCVHL